MKALIQAVTTFAVFAAPIIGLAVLLFVIVRSVLNFLSTKSGRGYIVFKALASLAVWLLASYGWFFMFFLTAYTAAGNGSAEDENTLDAFALLFLDLIYGLIGCGLAWWVWRKSGKGQVKV